MKKTPIVIPDDAHIFYVTPTALAGKYNRDRGYSVSFNDEEKARKFAAGGSGNGSGVIFKRTRFSKMVTEEETGYSGTIEYNLEQRIVVTKFTPEGKIQRKKYLELLNCKHKNTKTVMYGAGCQKDYDTICTTCQTVVVG